SALRHSGDDPATERIICLLEPFASQRTPQTQTSWRFMHSSKVTALHSEKFTRTERATTEPSAPLGPATRTASPSYSHTLHSGGDDGAGRLSRLLLMHWGVLGISDSR